MPVLLAEPPQTREETLAAMNLQVFEERTLIMSAGDRVRSLFLVLRGEIGVYSRKDSEVPLKILQSGDTFGDLSPDGISSQTFLSQRNTYCGVVSYSSYQEVLRLRAEADLLKKVAYFSENPIFSGLAASILLKIYRASAPHS